MQLPFELRDRIRQLFNQVPEQELRGASRRLTDTYKSRIHGAAINSQADRTAYLAVRLPATYAAVRAVLEEAAERIPGFVPRSVLDLGSGPGTALWAVREVFPSVSRLFAVERDKELARLGQELAADARWCWESVDVRTWTTTEKFDLVIASYSLGELTATEQKSVVGRAWNMCGGALVLVEPGTRRGFEVIAEARAQLLETGARLAAPCPHGLECPMRVAGDWCHFSARVERSAEHRRIKGGELGYEDEKFSYVVASRLPVNAAGSRIVRHPMRYGGFTKLQLCTPEGLREETVTRSQKERYREAKRKEWGSGWR